MRGAVQVAASMLALAACGRAPAPLPSLKDDPGYFRVVQDAPQSRFEAAGTDSATAGPVPESSFGPARDDASEFRLAEVAPDRLDETRTLLTQLGAREDGSHAIRFSLPADVLFDFDKATLRPDAAAPMAQAQRLIAAYPQAPLAVTGHTDAKGDDAYNDRLSLARARTVAGRLAADGERRPVVKGMGEREPAAPNTRPDGSDDPDGRQRNRRVEITIMPLPAAARGN